MTSVEFIENEQEEARYLQHIQEQFGITPREVFTGDVNINKLIQSWKTIEEHFFTYFLASFGWDWKYDTYYGIFSRKTAFSFGSPFPEFEQKILIDLRNGKYLLRTIAHELAHQYYHNIIYNILEEESYGHSTLNELFVTHMLFDTPLNQFFDDNNTALESLQAPGCYEEAVKLYPQSKELWEKKKNLQDYLDKMMKLIEPEHKQS